MYVRRASSYLSLNRNETRAGLANAKRQNSTDFYFSLGGAKTTHMCGQTAVCLDVNACVQSFCDRQNACRRLSHVCTRVRPSGQRHNIRVKCMICCYSYFVASIFGPYFQITFMLLLYHCFSLPPPPHPPSCFKDFFVVIRTF